MGQDEARDDIVIKKHQIIANVVVVGQSECFKPAVSNTRPAGRMWPAIGTCAARELSHKLENANL